MSSVGPTAAVTRDWTSLCRTASVLAMVTHREPIPIGRMPESGALVLLRGMPRTVEKDEDRAPWPSDWKFAESGVCDIEEEFVDARWPRATSFFLTR